MISHEMTTTAFDIPGFTVTGSLGIVRGIVDPVLIHLRYYRTQGLQTLVGGDITIFTQMCEKTREDSFERMLQHAAELGAHAIVGVRYDATEVMDGVTEVLCYGTAVQVQKN